MGDRRLLVAASEILADATLSRWPATNVVSAAMVFVGIELARRSGGLGC